MNEQKWGVIVGVSEAISPEKAEEFKVRLEQWFPGVRFALVSHATSVAFPLPEVTS